MRIYNPVEHLQWTFFAKVVEGWKTLTNEKAPS